MRLGGIVAHAPHPKGGALNGAPQVLEVSRDGRRVYATNSLYSAVDAQFYPEGINGWMAKIDVNPAGGMSVDPNFFVPFRGERPHQTRLPLPLRAGGPIAVPGTADVEWYLMKARSERTQGAQGVRARGGPDRRGPSVGSYLR